MPSELKIQYSFHPHKNIGLKILLRPRDPDGCYVVVDPHGYNLKVPAWMIDPRFADVRLSGRAAIAASPLLRLCELLAEWL